MATTTRTVTYEEWLEMPVVEDATEEVVNGEIRIMPRPKFKHTLIAQKLGKLLSTQGDENLILVLMAPFGLIIRRFPLTSRAPDLAVFLKKNIVEVLSSANTRLERAGNLRDYEQGRVPEVWVLHSGSANCRSARVAGKSMAHTKNSRRRPDFASAFSRRLVRRNFHLA